MRRALLIAIVVFSTLGVVAGAIWGGLEGGDMLWPVTWVVWAPVGTLILWKRPRNGVGIAMLAIGVCWGVSFLCLAVAFSSGASLEVRGWAEFVNVIFGVLPWLGIIWLLLIFPSGRLEGMLERVTGVALGALAALGLFSFTVSPEPMDATGLPSPLAAQWLSGLTNWFVEAGFVFVLVVTLAAISSLIYDSERVADEFAESLRDRVDPKRVVDGWVGVVSETLQPAAVGVWVRDSE